MASASSNRNASTTVAELRMSTPPEQFETIMRRDVSRQRVARPTCERMVGL
jgi:hypothetical protein